MGIKKINPADSIGANGISAKFLIILILPVIFLLMPEKACGMTIAYDEEYKKVDFQPNATISIGFYVHNDLNEEIGFTVPLIGNLTKYMKAESDNFTLGPYGNGKFNIIITFPESIEGEGIYSYMVMVKEERLYEGGGIHAYACPGVTLYINVPKKPANIWTTDELGNAKLDFAPEEIVYISGSGFDSASAENPVQLQITRPNGENHICPDEKWCPSSLPANSSFSLYSYNLDGIEGVYTIKANDGINQAENTFNDSIALLCVDNDNDGYGSNGSSACSSMGLDCDDNNQEINPGKAEVCNHIDDNCDGLVDDNCEVTEPAPTGNLTSELHTEELNVSEINSTSGINVTEVPEEINLTQVNSTELPNGSEMNSTSEINVTESVSLTEGNFTENSDVPDSADTGAEINTAAVSPGGSSGAGYSGSPGKVAEKQKESCSELWICPGGWGECSLGWQTRTCRDLNNCGTYINKPTESRACTIPAPVESPAEPEPIPEESQAFLESSKSSSSSSSPMKRAFAGIINCKDRTEEIILLSTLLFTISLISILIIF
ncbi:MAG: putative metal-binding motif-containing protein [Candidatus Woesearchaeota archaeon]|nr:putative metal-binding motif-containing protein [Candidatus Woesearchaeota archaeon]